MFIRKSKKSFLIGATALAFGVAGLTGCDTGREAEVGVVEPGAQEEPVVQEGEAAEEGKVVSETLTPAEQNAEIGDTEVQRGEEAVAVRRRIVTTELEQLDVPTVTVCEEHADLNRMEARHFVALGIPQQSAESIVQYREQQGPFSSEAQLSQVQGLGQNDITRIQEVADVSPQQAQQGQQGQQQAE